MTDSKMNEKNSKNLKRKTITSMIWKFGEQSASRFVSMFVTIILARILLPEDYGVIAQTTIFISICNVFVTSGFAKALIQKKDSDELDFSSVFYASLVISTTLYAILFFCAPAIAEFYDSPLLAPVLRVLGLRLPISALGSVQEAYVSKHLLFRRYFYATFISISVSAALGIWMAYNGYGVWALVAQELSNVVLAKILMLCLTKWHPHLCFSFRRVKTLLSYGWKILASSLLDTVYNELRGLIIGKRYSSADLAYYNKGLRWPGLFGELLSTPINTVLFSVMSKVQDDPVQIKAMTRRDIKTSCYIIYPCLAGLAVTAPTLIPFLYTEKWSPCIPYVQILCVFYIMRPIYSANSEAIKAIGRSNIFLAQEIIKKVIGVAGILISMWFGVFWMVMSTAITAVINTVIDAYPNKKLINYGLGEQLKDLLPCIALTLVMAAAVYFLNFLSLSLFLRLVIQVLVGAAIYVGGSALFKLEAFEYLLGILKGTISGKSKQESEPSAS